VTLIRLKNIGKKVKNSLFLGIKLFHFSLVIQEASGERLAALGNLKPADRSKAIPG